MGLSAIYQHGIRFKYASILTFLLATFFRLAFPAFARPWISRIFAHLLLQHPHSFAEIIFPKLALLVDDKVYPLSTGREQIALLSTAFEVNGQGGLSSQASINRVQLAK